MPATCCAPGSTTRAGTAPSSSTTPPTRRTSGIRTCRAPSSRSRAPGSAPSSSAAFEDRRVHGHALRLHRRAKELQGRTASGQPSSLHALWFRRQSTKFNGVPTSSSAARPPATPTRGGKRCRLPSTSTWRRADHPRRAAAADSRLRRANATCIWVKTPPGLDSWSLFDKLLTEAHVVVTPASASGRAARGLPVHRLRPARADGGGGRADSHPAPAGSSKVRGCS